MDDYIEGDHQVSTTSKKQQCPQYIAPMSMNKFAKMAKQNRVFAPKVSRKFQLDLNNNRSQMQRGVFEKNVTQHNYINAGAKRQPGLLDEDDDEYDETFHQDVSEESVEQDGLKDDENEVVFTKGQDAVCETEQEIGNGITGKKRGITCGKGARKIMRTSKTRFPLEFNFRTHRVISENESTFMNECGYIVRNNCSLQFKDWRLVPNEVKLPLRHKLTTLFDIDVENSNICKVIDSYMGRAWRNHRAALHLKFKNIRGSKDPKTTPPSNVRKEDWEYLCDMWCDPGFLEIAKKRVEARGKRKINSRNGSKSTIRYHLENGYHVDSSSGQIETWRLTHWSEEKGWISIDASTKYEDMMKLRNEHSVESMSDKTILEKVLGRSSVRLHGWGRDPTIGSNTMGTNRKSKRPTYDEVLDALEKLQGTCAIMQQALIENNIMSPLPSTTRLSQGDTSESGDNVDE